MLDMPGDSGFRDVAPAGSQRLAYWQRPIADQPRFLKAALLQRDNRWDELRSLAAEWARADAGDAEPWYLLSVALSNMNRIPEARHALDCSMAIDPLSASAWARLAPTTSRNPATEGAAPAADSGVPSRSPARVSDRPTPFDPLLTCAATAPLLRTP